MVKPVNTLGDARDVGLELIAICRNILCRRRTVVDLHQLIYLLGEGRSILPERGKVHFSEKMRCNECGGVGAYLWPREMKGEEPFFSGLSYQVNEWMGSRNLQVVAKVSNLMVAHAAFEASTVEYPGRRLTLQQKAFVLRDSRLTVIEGGRK